MCWDWSRAVCSTFWQGKHHESCCAVCSSERQGLWTVHDGRTYVCRCLERVLSNGRTHHNVLVLDWSEQGRSSF